MLHVKTEGDDVMLKAVGNFETLVSEWGYIGMQLMKNMVENGAPKAFVEEGFKRTWKLAKKQAFGEEPEEE